MGTSQGGREALEVAQRYPDDYDGVMATVPLIGYSAHVIAKTLYATLQTGDGWIRPKPRRDSARGGSPMRRARRPGRRRDQPLPGVQCVVRRRTGGGAVPAHPLPGGADTATGSA